MNAEPTGDMGAASVAAAIGEPARARMLYCLLDGRARTSTELAIVGEVSPSTASVHLARLKEQRLVSVLSQGKHRYYSLGGTPVARALEALTVVAGGTSEQFVPRTPIHLLSARTCYDHMAGHMAVLLRERRPHIGGALGHAILKAALKRQWFVQDLDSRALTLTALGRRQMQAQFGLKI
jgi:DNA-binding transcriptional ArsR family regulator